MTRSTFNNISRFLAICLSSTFLTTSVHAQSTGATLDPNCTTPTKFFSQPIDHSNASAGTFQQQYQILADHFKPGGPIFYYQQAETVTFACMERFIFPEWAEEVGALVISLEHRFFGLSIPSNATDVIERYQSLTLENVMDDAVNFVGHVKNTISGAEDSKAFVFGGSYGGFLTTVLKTNHPDVFYGAIPFAAPLRSIGANYQNPKRFDWFTYTSQIYWDLSAAAATKLQNAFRALKQRFDTAPDMASIAADFNLCTVPSSATDLEHIMGFLNTAMFLITQLSYASPDVNPTGASAQKLVNETLKLTDPTDIINATLNVNYPPSSPLYPCISWDASHSATPTLEKAPFNYLLCNYFPLSTSEISNGTIFNPTSTQEETDPKTCKELFNLTPPTQDYVEKKYKITREDLVCEKRILFAYDEMDPTTAVGIKPLPLTPDRNASRYMFTSLSAHGESSIASFPGDKQSVIHVNFLPAQSLTTKFYFYVRCGATLGQADTDNLDRHEPYSWRRLRSGLR